MEEVSILNLLLKFGNYVRSEAYKQDVRDFYAEKGFSVPEKHDVTPEEVDRFLNRQENIPFHELLPMSLDVPGSPDITEHISGPFDKEGLENPPSEEYEGGLVPKEATALWKAEEAPENETASAKKKEGDGDDDSCCVQTYPS